jgi:hypothetical protein
MRVDTSEEDVLDIASLLKRTGVRIVGAAITFTFIVSLALGGLDMLTQHALSRALGGSDAEIQMSRLLTAHLIKADTRGVAAIVASPVEPLPRPMPDVTAAIDPSPIPTAAPDPQRPPMPAPPPASPVAAAPPPALPVAIALPPPSGAPPASVQPITLASLAVELSASDASLWSMDAPLSPIDESELKGAAEETEVKAPSVPLPLRAPKRPPPPLTPAQRLKLDAKGRAKAEKCLAEAVYFEARSEGFRGQLAVAQVVMNRVFSPFYPNDVCGVVYQNAHRHLACQFTFACDGIPERITEWDHWRVAKHIAKQTLDGKVWVPEVARSTHYHAVYVKPRWVREMRKMVRYGVHTFYRPRRWGDGSHETTWSNITHIASRAAIVD